ncbi:MAG TPA: redox-regulated ATPase YchF [Phycisphaerales bacterium]|nr:redox-regulated ATPase YchF [Phycisphaerales bacterium]
MRVALIGPVQSGKSTLFAAVAAAGGSHVDLSRPDQPHLAVVKVPDERLVWLTEQYHPQKTTPAELEFLDLPGFDLSDEAGRNRAKTHWPAMRNSDMLVLVVRAFEGAAVAAYRGRVDPQADVQELLAELLFADLDQVTGRIAKLEASIKKPTAKRDEYLRELELMKRLEAALEAEKPISEAIHSDAEGKLVRSFAFLSQKPLLVVKNLSEGAVRGASEEAVGGVECLPLSAKIEEEIAELPSEERGVFLADLGVSESARDRLIRACYRKLNLVSFLTTGEDEVRAWTIPAGADAVTAAGEIHSDIARGFIRAETVSYDDLRAAGDMKAAKAAGKIRLEGKTYVVRDGDIINFRFNV